MKAATDAVDAVVEEIFDEQALIEEVRALRRLLGGQLAIAQGGGISRKVGETLERKGHITISARRGKAKGVDGVYRPTTTRVAIITDLGREFLKEHEELEVPGGGARVEVKTFEQEVAFWSENDAQRRFWATSYTLSFWERSQENQVLCRTIRDELRTLPTLVVARKYTKRSIVVVTIRKGYLEEHLGREWRPVPFRPLLRGSVRPVEGARWVPCEGPGRQLSDLLKERKMGWAALARATGFSHQSLMALNKPCAYPSTSMEPVGQIVGVDAWVIWPHAFGYWERSEA